MTLSSMIPFSYDAAAPPRHLQSRTARLKTRWRRPMAHMPSCAHIHAGMICAQGCCAELPPYDIQGNHFQTITKESIRQTAFFKIQSHYKYRRMQRCYNKTAPMLSHRLSVIKRVSASGFHSIIIALKCQHFFTFFEQLCAVFHRSRSLRFFRLPSLV